MRKAFRRLLNDRRNSLMLLLLYRIFLDLCYIYAISPKFSYLDSKLDFSLTKFVLSYFFMIALYRILPGNGDKVSNVILHYFYLIMVVPMLSNLGLANQSIFYTIVCSLAFSLTIFYTSSGGELRALKRIKMPTGLVRVCFVLTVVIVILILVRKFGIHTNAFDLAATYQIRRSISITGILGYLFMWSYKIVAPYMIAFGLNNRSWLFIMIGVLIELIMFLVTPHKEMILLIGLTIVSYYAIKNNVNFFRILTLFLTLFTLLSTVIYLISSNFIPISFVSRLLTGPAITKFGYYEFFKTQKKLLYAGATLGKLFGIEYPYDMPLGNYMAYINTGTYGNEVAGYLGSAYANWGTIGVFVQSIFMGMLLRCFDSFSKKYELPYLCTLTIYPLSQLNDNDMLTVFFSGGVFLLIILLYIDKPQNIRTATKERRRYRIRFKV